MAKEESKQVPCPIAGCGKIIKGQRGVGPHIRYAHEHKPLGVVPAKDITKGEAKFPPSPLKESVQESVKEIVQAEAKMLAKTRSEGMVEEKPLKSWEDMGLTEYQQFLSRGITIGVDTKQPGLAALVTEHIFSGGDYRDMDWVWQGLNAMSLRPDYTVQWFNSWRSHCHKGTPNSIAKDKDAILSVLGDTRKEGSTELTHRLDEADKPVYCGAGLGDMTYKDALELSKIRASRRPESPAKQAVSEMDLVTKAIGAVRDLSGLGKQQKSYLVMPGPDGQMIVQEQEEGRPVVVNPPVKQEEKKTTSYVVDAEGGVQQFEEGSPIVIKPPIAREQQKIWVVDKGTGAVQPIEPGQPVIIRVEPPVQSQGTPIQMVGPDGKPLILDLNTLITYNKAMAEERRAEEGHKTKQEMAGALKEFITKLGRAAGRAGGD